MERKLRETQEQMPMSGFSHKCDTSCDCGDCHECIANLGRWGDPDGREGRMWELRYRLDQSDVAWAKGEEDDLTTSQRAEWIHELHRMRTVLVTDSRESGDR